MLLLKEFIILALGLLVLGKSANLVVKNLIRIANLLRLSTFIVSFVVLGIATSTPEIFVGINSIGEKTPQLSLGNVIGASIVLLTLITGATALITGKVILDAAFTKKNLVIMNFVILMPVFLIYDGRISKFDSLLMLLAYGIYVISVYRERHILSHPIANHNHKSHIGKNIIILILGFIGLAYASRFAVHSAVNIASILKIPILILGILLFSLGTNLPEFIITFTSIRKGQKTIALGNVMGSAATNTLVIAAISFLQPFEILDFTTFIVSVFFLATTVISFSLFIKSKNEISRIEGVFLLSIYFFFVLFEVIGKLL